MAKEDLLELDGTVVERLPDSRFRVRLDNGHETLAYSSGRLKKHRIRILEGDRVTMEMTPYDLSKGRICSREKDTRVLAPGHQRKRYNRGR
jgi:translation initiation factor IF-1